MSEQDESYARRKSLGEETLTITLEQFQAFVVANGGDSQCSCGIKDWHFPHEEGRPTITAMPMVRNPDASTWSYWIVCNHCGHIRLIAAGKVWYQYFGGRE